MKVSFKQSGGYAGLHQGCALDTETMSPEEEAQLQALLAQSGVMGDRAQGSTRDQGAAMPVYDAFNYEITVESPEGTRTISLSDAEVTDAIAPLLGHLIDRAQPQPPQ